MRGGRFTKFQSKRRERVHMSIKRETVLVALGLLAFAPGSFAQQSSKEFGNELLRQRCASCHAIGPSDRSRHPRAPEFRNIVKRYSPDTLAEALAEGIMTGHPDMPIVTFEPHEIGPIIEYLEQLSKEHR